MRPLRARGRVRGVRNSDDGTIGSESLEQHRLDVAENLTKMAEKHHTIKPKKMRILPEASLSYTDSTEF